MSPSAETRRAGFWELVGAGVAIGGTGVWGLAAAARVGLLRLLLEQLPPAWWDGVTWVLIPVLLLLPPVVQGVAVACLAAGRWPRVGLPVAGSVGGTVLAALVFGGAFLVGTRNLPVPVLNVLARTAPVSLIIGFIVVIVAGWILIAGMVLRMPGLRSAALFVGLVATFLAWILVRGHVLALTYVLERTEVEGFFVSVALGGAVGAAWVSRRMSGGDLTDRERVGYNPPAPGERAEAKGGDAERPRAADAPWEDADGG
jgi:hypothetical protein